MSHQDYPAAALEAMNELMTGLNSDPEGRKCYELAAAELSVFLARHQYYGEAAVMIASLVLAQDEEPNKGIIA